MISKYSGRFTVYWIALFAACTCCFWIPAVLLAQTAAGLLHGQVTDPAGAVVTDARVTVSDQRGKSVVVKSNRQGEYEVKGLAPGSYVVAGSAKGFAEYTNQDITIAAGASKKLDITLQIAVEKTQVTVEDEAPSVSVDPESNASSTVIKGKDLDALSDDSDELATELQALAGPSTGPNGGQIYIDGFTGGQLPPKASIREIRINQNPFSAEYDRLGYGRIEVFTKPGTDKYHGELNLHGNNAVFNSKNKFLPNEPGYDSLYYSGSIGGPIGKKASFFFNLEHRNINEESISTPITGVNPDGSFILTPQALANPRTRTNVGPRFDYQITPTNTLTARYQYVVSGEKNNLNNQFALASQAFNADSTEHTIQLSDTQVYGSKIVNETRFRLQRQSDLQRALSQDPTINVIQALTAGGNSIGTSHTTADHYEIQNYTSVAQGNHFVRFGARIRISDEQNYSTSNFNGVYTFTSITDYLNAQAGIPGFGPSQFSITTGQPSIANNFLDAGLYAEDDWKLRPNLTLSYGLRYETQNNIHDHNDWAPRIGIAWGLGRAKSSPTKTVLRAGYGIFYDRFGQDLVLQADRLNGFTEQQYVIKSPSYPILPSVSSLNAVSNAFTKYQIDPRLRAPYTMQTAVSLERQLGKLGTIAVTYLNARGVHQLLTLNINAPLDGTYDPAVPGSGVRPLGNIGNIYQYQSEGIFKQNQLITNLNLRVGSKVSLFGYYTLNFAKSDTAGAGSFPTDQYNIARDFGRTSFDVRNRVFLGGTLSLPYKIRLSPFLVAQSGQPFNITLGRDLNGDSIFNDRPAIDGSGVGAVLNSNPATQKFGQFTFPAVNGPVISPFSAPGPSMITFNLRASKTIGLGKHVQRASGDSGQGGGGDRGHGGPGGGFRGLGGGNVRGMMGGGATSDQRYSLTFSVSGRNIFNNVNLAPPNGNLSSPNFGQSTALAGGPFNNSVANRRVDLQVAFNF